MFKSSKQSSGSSAAKRTVAKKKRDASEASKTTAAAVKCSRQRRLVIELLLFSRRAMAKAMFAKDNTEASNSGAAKDLETTWLVTKEEFSQQRQLAEATMTKGSKQQKAWKTAFISPAENHMRSINHAY